VGKLYVMYNVALRKPTLDMPQQSLFYTALMGAAPGTNVSNTVIPNVNNTLQLAVQTGSGTNFSLQFPPGITGNFMVDFRCQDNATPSGPIGYVSKGDSFTTMNLLAYGNTLSATPTAGFVHQMTTSGYSENTMLTFTCDGQALDPGSLLLNFNGGVSSVYSSMYQLFVIQLPTAMSSPLSLDQGELGETTLRLMAKARLHRRFVPKGLVQDKDTCNRWVHKHEKDNSFITAGAKAASAISSQPPTLVYLPANSFLNPTADYTVDCHDALQAGYSLTTLSNQDIQVGLPVVSEEAIDVLTKDDITGAKLACAPVTVSASASSSQSVRTSSPSASASASTSVGHPFTLAYLTKRF